MRSGLLLGFAFAACTLACGSNDTPATSSLGPVSLAITALHPRGRETWALGDPEPLSIGCDRRLGVDTTVVNFLLRAPDACSSAPQCGMLALDVDPPDAASPGIASLRSANPNVVVDLAPLEKLGILEGPHTLRPSLMRSATLTFTGPYQAEPEALSVSFVAEDCSSGAGGAGASAGAAGEDAGGAGPAGAGGNGAGGGP